MHITFDHALPWFIAIVATYLMVQAVLITVHNTRSVIAFKIFPAILSVGLIYVAFVLFNS